MSEKVVAIPSSAVKSEDILGQKWDKFLSDSVIKTGGGFLLGSVFSLMLFRRRAWPLIFGGGAGFGMAFADAQRDFSAKKEKSK